VLQDRFAILLNHGRNDHAESLGIGVALLAYFITREILTVDLKPFVRPKTENASPRAETRRRQVTPSHVR
jgi:hypothetical protein